ncbi:MAG: hypothetical protein WC943_17900 [Elusimicrobiota bacterium]|jgi:hypothetical protein
MLLAKKACADPGSVTQADVKELEEMSFPNPRLGLGTADSFPSHMWSDRCSKDLYDALARINRSESRGFRLNVAWVNWQAGQFVRRDQPVEAPRQTPRQEVEPEQRRNDRIDLPTLENILGRLGGR